MQTWTVQVYSNSVLVTVYNRARDFVSHEDGSVSFKDYNGKAVVIINMGIIAIQN